jgi:hypothetical protein
MWTLGLYVLVVTLGAFAASGVGLILDKTSPTLSVPIFIALFFSVMWFGWHVALWISGRIRPAD